MSDLANQLSEARRLLDAGVIAGARARLEAIVAAAPTSREGQLLLGLTLSRLREWAAAAERYRRAIELGDEDSRTVVLLGESLRNAGDFEAAAAALTRAVELGAPSAGEALAQTLMLSKRHAEAVEACRGLRGRAAGTLAPAREANILACEAMSLLEMGHAEEAVETYRRALALNPGDHLLASGLATTMNYASGFGAAEVRAAHEAYGRIVEASLARAPRPLHQFGARRTLLPGERLRVGLISPDLRAHAVACFLGPLLEHLGPRVEVFCYSVSAEEDEVTAGFRRAARSFRSVGMLNGFDLAKVIAADRVHVLVDCAGHTRNSRLPVLELRPAPVQALYLGYPATSGMRAVDWRIVDSLSDPPGSEAASVERLRRVDPCALVFRLVGKAPRPEAVPPSQRESGGAITFGSFSTVSKISAEVPAAWARVVLAVPGSRLLLKHDSMKDERTRDDLRRRFGAAGLSGERLVIEPPAPGPGGLLVHYARVDVALDTFPYCGTTTVCEALAMGVPVVARPGETTVSRGSLSILSAVGLGSQAAGSTEEFVAIAAGLAHDGDRLATIRRDLPERVRVSAIGDYAGFAERFERALMGMWAGDAI